MDISKVNMDGTPDTSIQMQTNAAVKAGSGAGGAGGKRGQPEKVFGDVYEIDALRQGIRDLLEEGTIHDHIEEIINSAIEPSCLRAELAFRAAAGDAEAADIILFYLAGDFKQAAKYTVWCSINEWEQEKTSVFSFFAAYFSGKLEEAYGMASGIHDGAMMSPLFCYAYSDVLLSLGYVSDAMLYLSKYEVSAKRYLKDYSSDREKYENEQKRRDAQKNMDNGKDSRNKGKEELLKELEQRRDEIFNTLGRKDVSYDKRLKFYELFYLIERIAIIKAEISKVNKAS